MERRLVIALGILAAGCGVTTCGAKQAGLPCTTAAECREGHVCVAGLDDRARCMLPCAADTFLCDDGALCIDRGADGRLCWYGGTVAQHFACDETVQCEAGTHCVDAGDETRTCEQACVVETNLPCRVDLEVCVAIPDSPAVGWCDRLVPSDGGDAGDLDSGPPDGSP